MCEISVALLRRIFGVMISVDFEHRDARWTQTVSEVKQLLNDSMSPSAKT